MKKEVQLENKKYQLIKEYKDGFQIEDIVSKYTDYFHDFDYIFGDYSYDKLRLKGLYRKENKNCKPFNNIENLDSYIKDFCAYECKYFLLEKMD